MTQSQMLTITPIDRSRRSHADVLAVLTGALAAAPNLPGALCRGHRSWDHDHDGEPAEDPEFREARLARSAHFCRTRCPAYRDCLAWLRSTPRSKRPTGAVAGLIIRPPGRCQDSPEIRPSRELGEQNNDDDRSSA